MEDGEKNQGSKSEEARIEVAAKTYCDYFFNSKVNYILIPITLLLFLLTELISTFFFKSLALYNEVKDGQNDQFETTSELWAWTGFLLLGCFLSSFIANFLINLAVLLSNNRLHDQMIEGLLRSPIGYFDKTPSGELTSKLSNDLTVLDTVLNISAMLLLEATSISLVTVGSAMQLNLYLVAPAVLVILFNILMSAYCYKMILVIQALSMKIKSPVFSFLSEMMNGIIQITLFNRRLAVLRNFAVQVNNSFKARMNLNLINSFFSIFINHAIILLMYAGLLFGIYTLTPQTYAEYGVIILLLYQMSNVAQLALRYFINFQTYMVNA